jgi:ATP-binding cassette, subfamily B, bacterial PglK
VSDHPMAEAAQSVLRLLSPQGNQPAPGASPDDARALIERPAVLGPPGVVARDVSFRYKSSTKNVLQRVSFEVDPGSIVAIVGPSGAGKTTLIELILGLESPTEGKLEIGSETPKDYRNGLPGVIGYVAQRPGVLSGSVLENIALDSRFRPQNQERLERAIEFAQLFDWIDTLPRKTRTPLGQQSEALSGGQLQRIGLARALYTTPKLLVMDEATSALDAETESFITERVLSLRGRITTIIVAHRLSTIRDVDKIFVLDRGKIVGAGTFEELRKSNRVFAKYVEILGMK